MFWLLLCLALIVAAVLAVNIVGAAIVLIRWNIAQRGAIRTVVSVGGLLLFVTLMGLWGFERQSAYVSRADRLPADYQHRR